MFQSLGEYVKAEQYLQKGIGITKEIGDKQGEASSYGNLGAVFQSSSYRVGGSRSVFSKLILNNANSITTIHLMEII